MTITRHFCRSLVLLSLSLPLLVACGQSETDSQAPAAMSFPPPAVDVATVERRSEVDWKEFTGRLEASASVVVKPRTSGYIVSIAFEDGALVKKGDLLYQVDFRTIEAEVERLQAEVLRVNAEIDLTERDLERAKSLRAKNAISQEQLDNRTTLLTQANAAAASARADLRRTQVLHAITKVKAPFDGRVSNSLVKEGSSVIAGQTVLTTLVSTDKVHAYFDVDENTYLKLQSLGFNVGSDLVTVKMGLANEKGFPHEGVIDFVDNQVDIATGTIRMRAVYENAKGHLTPGLFARLKMQIGQAYEAILIPETAIGTDLSSKFVLVLGEGNIATYRPVVLGSRRGEERIVKEGLKEGDVVIVSGLQRARPGTPVAPNDIAAKPAE